MKHFLLLLFVIAQLLFIPGSADAQWTKKADALNFRSDVPGSVVYNGQLYVFIGFYDSGLHINYSSEKYDPLLNKWTALKSIASNKAMTHQGVVLVDDKVFHIGGRVGDHPGALTNETWIYNITSNSWSQGPSLVDPLTGKAILYGAGGVALLGRTIHLFGGFVATACKGDQSTYHLTLDVDAWLANPSAPRPWKNESAVMPISRNHFSTVVLNGKIYAMGGQFGHDCGGGQDQKYAHVYNPDTDKWTELTQLPIIRSHSDAACFAVDGKIYLVGGQGANGQSVNYVTVLDPAGNNGKGSWSTDPDLLLPTVYEGASAKLVNNTIILSHGGVGTSKKPRKLTYVHTMIRNPVYAFGFPIDSAEKNVKQGSTAKGSTLLYTTNGTKNYSLSSNASWLTITRNASGTAVPNGTDISYAINSTSLAGGEYTALITATPTGLGQVYAPAVYKVKLRVCDGAATDICNGIDDDCDGLIDEDCSSVSIIAADTATTENKLTAVVRVSLTATSAKTVTVRFDTRNGTAAAPGDYSSKSNSLLTFSPGQKTKYVSITVKKDNVSEGTETFQLVLKNPVNAVIDASAGGKAISTINIANSASGSNSILLEEERPISFLATVRPNPSSGEFILLLEGVNNIPVLVHVRDILGRPVEERRELSDRTIRIGSGWKSGMYIVDIIQGSNKKTIKLVKI